MPTPMLANVLTVFDSATDAEHAEGMSWYDDAHSFARFLSPFRISRGAGVIAALSPMMGWDTNKKQALAAFTNLSGEGLGLSKNCAKADRILYGTDPLSVLSGNKVRAFYRTILEPWGMHAPVIDRHAFDIAVGSVTDDVTRSILGRKGMYDAYADVYIDAAFARGVSSSQMQAVTWIAWRNIKRGK